MYINKIQNFGEKFLEIRCIWKNGSEQTLWVPRVTWVNPTVVDSLTTGDLN